MRISVEFDPNVTEGQRLVSTATSGVPVGTQVVAAGSEAIDGGPYRPATQPERVAQRPDLMAERGESAASSRGLPGHLDTFPIPGRPGPG